MKNQRNDKQESHPQQVRGAELREKMAQSEEKGEKFRAQHMGQDARKTPNTSNTKKSHQS